MRLVSIFNVWKDYDLLEHALRCIRPLVDGVIIVASEESNYGEKCAIPDWPDIYRREPQFRDPRNSETDKRNYGLSLARQQGYTHFVSMDADEFYEPEAFLKAKEAFLNTDLKGMVCRCQTYFKSPHLTVGIDTTLVPFIHQITPGLRHEFNREYPFAWEGRNIRIDPTRSLSIKAGVVMSDVIMHHFSWVRSDYGCKIRNSTARTNLERSSIRNDLLLAKEGYYVEFYKRHLQRSTVAFGIPELST